MPRTEGKGQASFSPFGQREVSVLTELALGHLRYHLTDVPPQSNSPPPNRYEIPIFLVGDRCVFRFRPVIARGPQGRDVGPELALEINRDNRSHASQCRLFLSLPDIRSVDVRISEVLQGPLPLVPYNNTWTVYRPSARDYCEPLTCGMWALPLGIRHDISSVGKTARGSCRAKVTI